MLDSTADLASNVTKAQEYLGLRSTALTAHAALGTTCPQPYSIEEPEPVAGGEPPGVVHQIPVRQVGVGP